MSDILSSPTTDPTLRQLPGAERTIPHELVHGVLGFEDASVLVLSDQPDHNYVIENPGGGGVYHAPYSDRLPEGVPALAFEVHNTAETVAGQVLAVAHERSIVSRVLGGLLAGVGVRRPDPNFVKVVLDGLEDGSTVSLSSDSTEEGGRITRLQVVRPGDGDAEAQPYEISWKADPKGRNYPVYPRSVSMAVTSGAEEHAGVANDSPINAETYSGALGALKDTLATLIMQTASRDMVVTARGLY